MANDGYAALMNEVDKGKPGGPRLVAFSAMNRHDMAGVALAISYQGPTGRPGRRWVTVRSMDAAVDNTMTAYCWKRRALRTFRLDRIKEAIDGDGEVIGGAEFARLMGAHASVPTAAPGSQVTAPAGSGFGAWSSKAGASQPAKEQPKPAGSTKDLVVGLAVIAAVIAIIVWLIL